jgi:hypothetical protein
MGAHFPFAALKSAGGSLAADSVARWGTAASALAVTYLAPTSAAQEPTLHRPKGTEGDSSEPELGVWERERMRKTYIFFVS